ncbi:hypothetical protein BaRGS_00007997 [Batillaria attramentaria]|uniref:Uncharacterized protein n=1 Tax=Batillaria attramentaria TaxID=370345 RepID=A0ABD0LMR6_9CAEN
MDYIQQIVTASQKQKPRHLFKCPLYRELTVDLVATPLRGGLYKFCGLNFHGVPPRDGRPAKPILYGHLMMKLIKP